MFEVENCYDRVTCLKTATEYAGNAVMWVYAFLIDKTLFDAGCANAKEDINQYASKVGVERVFVTHTHEDHVGACSLLSQYATIYARPQHFAVLKDPPQYSEFFAWVWGQPDPVDKIETMDTTFDVGDLSFKVIDLPGHAPDTMVGFLEESLGWFFSADGVPLPTQKKLAMNDENIAQVISSLEKIQTLDIKVLFDSHRGPVEDPAEHIQKRIDYLKDLRLKAKELHEKGLSIEEIQKTLELEGPWYMDSTAGRFGIDFLLKSLLFDEP